MQSTKNKVYQIGKYQSNTYKVSSNHPLSINKNNYTTVQSKGFSDFTGNKNLGFDNQSIIDSLNLAIQNRNYTLVEYIPDINIVYYDSNSRKYRCYSATLKKPTNNLNLISRNLTAKQNLFKNKLNNTGNINTNANINYNQSFNTTYNSKTINHTKNVQNTQSIQNQYRINKSSSTNKNQIPNITNKYSHSTNSNTTIQKNLTNIRSNKYQTTSKNDNNNNNNQYRRINSYINKTEQNKGLNKADINNNKNTYRNKTTSMNQTLTQNGRRNNDDSKYNTNTNKTQLYSSKTTNIKQMNQNIRINSEEKNYLKNKLPSSNINTNTYQRNQGGNIVTNRAQSVNVNQINQGRRRNDETLNKNSQTNNNNNTNQDRGRSVGVISNRAQTNNISQINQNRGKIEGGKLVANKTQTNIVASQNNQYRRNNNINNENQKQLLLNRVQKSQIQERKTQENRTNIPNLNHNRKVYQEDINSNKKNNISSNYKINQTPIPNNRSVQKDYHLIKDIKDLSAIDLQQELQKLKSPYKNEEIVKDENGEIVQRKEENTIAIIAGQKIEPKSVIETFEKPTIEIIQNEDGTSQSVIKQTKIITSIENIPIQSGVKNGKDDLQLVKQIITHEYKTLSAAKDKLDNDNKEENKDEENNKENIEKNENENEINKEGQLAKGENKEKFDDKEKDTLGEKKGNVKNDKKMRYMDIVSEENKANENTKKDNKNTKGNKKTEAKKEIANKEMNDKNVIPGDNQKNKIQNKDKAINQKDKKETETLAKNANKKQEITSKAKNTKTDLPEKKLISSKDAEKSSLARANKTKEKSGNEELINKKSDISKSKDKKTTKEKTSQEINNKELNVNAKKGKASEETDLRKPFRKKKYEEKDNIKQLNSPENNKIIFELYEKCFKAGNKTNKEKEITKIVEIIVPFGEKEAKDILAKLLKSFPKSSELNQKLLNLIITKIKSNTNLNAKSKGKQAENKLSLEKEKEKSKETRSKSQIKSSGIKNNRMNIEEGIAKTEINQRIKFEKNEDKFDSTSKKYGINSTLNRLGGYSINTANIGDLKFDGLFLDISKYQNTAKDKNPFEGPSSFYKFYKVRQSQIKKKINDMTIESKNN